MRNAKRKRFFSVLAPRRCLVCQAPEDTASTIVDVETCLRCNYKNVPATANIQVSIWGGSKFCKNCPILENNSALERSRRVVCLWRIRNARLERFNQMRKKHVFFLVKIWQFFIFVPFYAPKATSLKEFSWCFERPFLCFARED